ncbi:hypothetical protein Fsol_00643 [Candidatus Fokinia solitaria]|uniref:Uncharacterized protein n=1 Tax=Candidatus Fokinia solitaria TaxID=1802984 RepID=A0A2U8BSV6_9RICK|nr:hypothetical protein Fsol_00643 [Candidatus Fokinia solitaria]
MQCEVTRNHLMVSKIFYKVNKRMFLNSVMVAVVLYYEHDLRKHYRVVRHFYNESITTKLVASKRALLFRCR